MKVAAWGTARGVEAREAAAKAPVVPVVVVATMVKAVKTLKAVKAMKEVKAVMVVLAAKVKVRARVVARAVVKAAREVAKRRLCLNRLKSWGWILYHPLHPLPQAGTILSVWTVMARHTTGEMGIRSV